MLVAACREPEAGGPAPFDPAAVALPEVEALPDTEGAPLVLEMWSEHRAIRTPAAFEARRRPEIALLLGHYVDGRRLAPGVEEPLPRAVVTGEEPLDADGVHLVRLHADAGGLAFTVDLALPPGDGPFPTVLGLSKCGIASVVGDPRLPLPEAWLHPDCVAGEAGRGVRADEWSLALAAGAGVAVAMVHESELAPDDPAEPAPIDLLGVDPGDDAARWGTVARWAAGLGLAADVLADRPEVDPARLVVFGHSRRGKAALRAAAADPRFVAVWAHQSGTAGAKETRSRVGEPLGALIARFPHWFADRLDGFVDREDRLPLDQDALLAALAPRTVWLTDGDADAWAGPDGVDAAIAGAAPAFALYGAPPPVHELRPGGHEVLPLDWELALDRIAGWDPE